MDKHTQQHNRSVRAVTVLLIAVMAVPLFTQLFMSGTRTETAQLVSMFNADIEAIRERALNDRMRVRSSLRGRERCLTRQKTNPKIVCPSLQDWDTTHSAAPTTTTKKAPSVSAFSVQQLSTNERRLLRSYTRAGFCSLTAGAMLYDLCIKLLGEDAADNSAPTGIENDNVELHSKNRLPGTRTLNDYLRMIDNNISNQAQETVRPTGY